MSKFLSRTLTVFGLATASLTAQTVESPTTVAPGEWLIEADVVAGLWDSTRINGVNVTVREIVAAPVLLSTGLSENLDIQFGFDGWVEAEAKGGGQREAVSGWGDAWLRAKWNFLGDEETGPAWALLPYLKLPLADDDIGNGEMEGGVAILFGQPIDDDDWLEAFVSVDTLYAEGGGRDEQLVAGAVWGRNISEQTTFYTEILAEWSSAESNVLPVVWGVGVSPVIGEGFALDFEILVGVTDEAPDWGAAIRLVWEL
ncbi:MAG: hypothetical protein SynsKO_36620 [Synoicihabitans sp.]